MRAEQKTPAVTAAKVIRVITVPPVMVAGMLGILYGTRRTIFSGGGELVLSLLFLAIAPALAYPAQKILPAYRDKGREGQRNLAFLFSFAGYAAALIYGLAAKSSDALKLIFGTYFFSVVLLIVLNKALRLRASGHAASIAGPLIFLCYFLGGLMILPCVALYGLILWASVSLKRHSVPEFLWGTAGSLLAFAGCLPIWM